MKAKVTVDGLVEAQVEGNDYELVISQAGLYFAQYAEEFEHSIRLEIEK